MPAQPTFGGKTVNKGRPKLSGVLHPQIRSLRAYQVPAFSGPVKLDAMESPYGFSESLKEKWLAHLAGVDVNRYPDPTARELKRKLREVFRIPGGLELTLGNGSDEILQLLQMAVGGYGRSIMAPQPSFAMYEIIAQYTRGNFIGVDLDENFQLPEDVWLSAVERTQPACIFFAYPNNPTGNFFDEKLIENTARISEGLVVVDEAYHAYSGKSMMEFVQHFENLVVVRTLSKSGFAGLRVGYMMSHPVWAAEFEKIRFPYNIGVLAQASAVFALDHWDEISRSTNKILSQRTWMMSQLQKKNSLKVFPSETNFITVKVMHKSATRVFEALREDGILIKNLDGSHPMLADCLRLTVGTENENKVLLNALIKHV